MKKILILTFCLQAISLIVHAQLPPAPTDVTAIGISTSGIRVSFTDNCDFEWAYHIQYATTPEGPFSTDGVFTLGTTIGEIVISDFAFFEPNTTVYVKVSGMINNDDGTFTNGPTSAVVSATTLEVDNIPDPPSDFNAVINEKKVYLTWTDNSNEAGFYLIRRDEDRHTVFEYILPANTTSYTDSLDIYKDVHFVYRLQSQNEFGYGGEMVSTSAFVASTPRPPAPDSVMAIGVSPSYIRISFRDNSDVETGYEIQFSDKSYILNENQEVTIGTVPGIGRLTSVDIDTEYEPGTTVYLQVRAFVDDGEEYPVTGAFSEIVSGTTLFTYPAAPSDFSAVQENNNVRLTWQDNADDEGGFTIMRANDGGSNFNIAFPVSANATTFLDTAVLPNIFYTYRIESVNEFGYGNEVVTTSVMVHSMLPAPVALLATFVKPTNFIANWSAVEGADAYKLYVFRINDSTALPGYDGLTVQGITHMVIGTKAGKQYAYYVKAVNSEQISERSNVVRAAPIRGLTLQTVCSDDPKVFREWKVTNNNHIPVEMSWRIHYSMQTGTMIAEPGESFFTTQTVPGSNKATITWYNDKLVRVTATQSSTGKSCTGSNNAVASGGGNENARAEGESVLALDIFPNPASDIFNIRIVAPAEKQTEVNIINFLGSKMFAAKVIGNVTLEIDASGYAPGIYFIKTNQTRNFKVVKLIKQ
jgi:hypothetical protein